MDENSIRQYVQSRTPWVVADGHLDEAVRLIMERAGFVQLMADAKPFSGDMKWIDEQVGDLWTTFAPEIPEPKHLSRYWSW